MATPTGGFNRTVLGNVANVEGFGKGTRLAACAMCVAAATATGALSLMVAGIASSAVARDNVELDVLRAPNQNRPRGPFD